METIRDIAAKAVTTPDDVSHVDTIRLGAWVLDHDEHVASHMRTMRATTPTAAHLRPPQGALSSRLAGLAPEAPSEQGAPDGLAAGESEGDHPADPAADR